MKVSGRQISITGERGFVGRHLTGALEDLDISVIPLSDINGDRADIRKRDQFRHVKDVDVLYHLAAVTSNSSCADPLKTYETNIMGTLNVLEFCRLCDINKIVYASSYVYGNPQYLPIDEKHTTNPSNPYSRSKLIGEELCRSYHDDFGIKCIILRPFNIYGPGQRSEFLIPKIISGLFRKEIILRDPEPKRDFVYISDMIDAYIRAGEYNCDFEIFNIGCGRSYSVKEIVEKTMCIYGSDSRVIYRGVRRKNEIMDCFADIKKAKSVLGWEPRIDIDEGLKLILNNLKG